ncbi:toll/interleukin-1 receptor domain-containing protein [Blastochloris sulfoviridis]|uniref:toll/interleukin-1 receptor domain-containing protein n=1 Tax=Blastochloris sulfoviridis TaxID=50712 RepID=UPI001AEE24DD|nr:toll/interleukin-1 receptor domain-containing protein [Blastochloris sulfoviridis]
MTKTTTKPSCVQPEAMRRRGLAAAPNRACDLDGIFLSHTGVDKPFVRQLRKDLMAHGVPRVCLDEAEIDIGDSLIAKIEEA